MDKLYIKKDDIEIILLDEEEINDKLSKKVDISTFNTLQTQIINIINGIGEG